MVSGLRAFFAEVGDCGGQAPALRAKRRFSRRARACPSPCIARLKKRPWPLCYRRFGSSRGQIICLVSVVQDHPILTCSGSGDPELLRFILLQTIGVAGDRPPRYGTEPPRYRRARACPSPCAGPSSKRPWSLGCGRFSQRSGVCGGQAPALRAREVSRALASLNIGNISPCLQGIIPFRSWRACPTDCIRSG